MGWLEYHRVLGTFHYTGLQKNESEFGLEPILIFRYAQKLLDSVLALSQQSPPLSSTPLPSETPPGPPSSLPSPRLSWSEVELEELGVLVEGAWHRVALYFELRLALAPCVEAMILLDRKLFLLEQGKGSTRSKTRFIVFFLGHQNVSLVQIFSSQVSPRNIVLLARHILNV